MKVSKDFLVRAAGAVSISGALLAALAAVLNAADHRSTSRGGNNVYREFRNFLAQADSEHDVLWLECCIGGKNRSSDAVLPIYTNAWHGLSSVWVGQVRTFRAAGPRGDVPGPEAIASGLVAIDQTRAPEGVRIPSELAERLGVDWATAWAAPPPNIARVVVFNAGASRDAAAVDIRVEVEALDSGVWTLSGVSLPELVGDRPHDLLRITGLQVDRIELIHTTIDRDFAAGLYQVEFVLARTPGDAFPMVRIEMTGSRGETRRHDVRVDLSGEAPSFFDRRMVSVRGNSLGDGLYRVRASFLNPEPATRVRLSIYPSAGVEFAHFAPEAVGDVLISTPRLIYRGEGL